MSSVGREGPGLSPLFVTQRGRRLHHRACETLLEMTRPIAGGVDRARAGHVRPKKTAGRRLSWCAIELRATRTERTEESLYSGTSSVVEVCASFKSVTARMRSWFASRSLALLPRAARRMRIIIIGIASTGAWCSCRESVAVCLTLPLAIRMQLRHAQRCRPLLAEPRLSWIRPTVTDEYLLGDRRCRRGTLCGTARGEDMVLAELKHSL